jgi:hypothetical protein
VSWSLKDRHMVGAGAAACAVCCAAPVLTLLGIAGFAATVATFVLAGLVFGLAVGAAAVFVVLRQRRSAAANQHVPCEPVDLDLSPIHRDEPL